MVARQSREQDRLNRFRMLYPGEIDHEVAPHLLIDPPVPVWDTATLATCASLYDRYVLTESQTSIPDYVFCDLPRWIFLEYVVRFRNILLFGCNSAKQTRLKPIVLSRNVYGWNVARHYAFSNSHDAFFHALLDRQRLHHLDCPAMSTMAWRFATPQEQTRWGFYFGIDYRALSHAPWRPGTVYLYRREDFPPDFETVSYDADRPILPCARIDVYPWDWPLLDQVRGVDIVAQTERQWETFRGYPWSQDAEIHPREWQRPLVDQTRRYLETHYAETIDLARLGARIGQSSYALLRMFRAHVGLSPREYQLHLRITQAKRLLRQGRPIARTASETGFCDQTHLNRHFRHLVGTTPGHYVRMQ